MQEKRKEGGSAKISSRTQKEKKVVSNKQDGNALTIIQWHRGVPVCKEDQGVDKGSWNGNAVAYTGNCWPKKILHPRQGT